MEWCYGSRAPRRPQAEAPPHGNTASRGRNRQHGEGGNATFYFSASHFKGDRRDGAYPGRADLRPRSKGCRPTQYGRALLKRGVAAFDEIAQAVKDIDFLAD